MVFSERAREQIIYSLSLYIAISQKQYESSPSALCAILSTKITLCAQHLNLFTDTWHHSQIILLLMFPKINPTDGQHFDFQQLLLLKLYIL